MTLVIGALTIGLILSVLALGVYISFRIFDFPDITAEGSITLGGAVTAVLIVAGVHPLAACGAAFAAGALAGTTTGFVALSGKLCLMVDAAVGGALHSVALRENGGVISGTRGVLFQGALGLGAHF